MREDDRQNILPLPWREYSVRYSIGWDARLVGSIAQPPSPAVSTEVAGKGGHSLDTAVRE